MVETETGALYTGISTDVKRRFSEHLARNSKSAKFFYIHKPKRIVLKLGPFNHSEALQHEWKIKKLSKNKKWQLIKDNENNQS